MHNYFPFAAIISCTLLLTSCGTKTETVKETSVEAIKAETPVSLTKAEIAKAYTVEGDTISPEGVVSVDSVESSLIALKNADFTVKAKVQSACQVKGCWMKVAMPSGKLMHITFKDYGFFVPKDIAGQEVIFSGYAYNDTLSVEELRHYAEDDGKSEEEISKITKPELTYLFNATGVLIPKKSL
jgi:hypothetical protein